jgi:hypothetical protein
MDKRLFGVLAAAAGVLLGNVSPVDARTPSLASPGQFRSASSVIPAGIPIPKGYLLKFRSRFSTGLNKSVWGTCYPWADTKAGCTNFGNGEYQWFLPTQDHVSGGLLYLTARRKATPGTGPTGQPKTYACRSGMVTTSPGFNFKFGIVRVVARMPSVAGMWPAIWLAASSRQFPPEIDIIEHWVRPIRPTGVFFHPVSGTPVFRFVRTSDLAVGWHTFDFVWTRTKMAWYINGRQVLSTPRVVRQAMYLVADNADAKKPSTGGCGGSLVIQSVKIWQR